MIMLQGWEVPLKDDVQANLDCCGWDTKWNSTGKETTDCPADCFTENQNPDNCHICRDVMEDKIDYAFNSSGGVGLFFAFTEVIF